MSDTPLHVLPEPPVVLQGARHVCWAAAYASWATAQGLPVRRAPVDNVVQAMSAFGNTQSPAGGVLVDADERLLPAGVALFGQMVGMLIQLARPARLSAHSLARKLRTFGYIWLWRTPRHGGAAHVVVIYGVVYDDQKQTDVLLMDPNVGLARAPWRDITSASAIFAVGTPVVPFMRADPFAALASPQTPGTREIDPLSAFF